MDCSLDFFTKTMTWGRPNDELQVEWSKLHLSIVRDYYMNISEVCDFEELPAADLFDHIFRYSAQSIPTLLISPEVAASFAQEIRRALKVPRPNKFQQHIKIRSVFMAPRPNKLQHQIKKYQLVEVFLTLFLNSIMADLCKDMVENLEKKLRFLLTILGHTSLVLCDDEHDSKQVQKLLKEFEGIANEAGSFLHSLVFSIDQVSGEMDEGLGSVVQHINLLNDRIMEFLNLVSSNSRQACKTPKASVVDSLLFVDSLIYYLEDLIERKDNRVIDLMDHIKILYKVLIVLKSSIEDIGFPQPSEISELKSA